MQNSLFKEDGQVNASSTVRNLWLFSSVVPKLSFVMHNSEITDHFVCDIRYCLMFIKGGTKGIDTTSLNIKIPQYVL